MVKVALAAAFQFGVRGDSLHLDSSSFSVHGAYLSPDIPPLEEPAAILIAHGYSRDHRPDLKQFMVDLMCSGDGDVPLYLRVADGHESDQAIFAQLIREFREKWDCEALFVADAALYSEENLQSLTNLRWLSRVPGTIKETQQLREHLREEAFVPSQLKGYRYACVCSTYAGLKQRWEETITLAHRRAGRFVLATNVLESESLSTEEMLCEYKGQQSTERGFRFLKDPMFFSSSVFLKTTQRVAALAMGMGLCLLIYTLAQRALRQSLAQAKQTISNQLGQPTATPTMGWVFQCFQSIHLVVLNGVQQVVNLTQEHQGILQFLGAPCQKYYVHFALLDR